MPRRVGTPNCGCRISDLRFAHRGNPAAFTLLEVLLALGIMSIVAVALFSSLHVAFKSKRVAEETLEPVRSGEAAVEMIRAELEGALPPGRGALAGAFVGRNWRGGAGGNRDDDDVTFFTAADAPAFAERFGEAKRVELTVVRMEDTGERALARRVISNLLAPTRVDPDDEILCRRVASFNLRYYDGRQWWDTWDSAREDDSLPVAVEVTLELDPPAGSSNTAYGARLVRTVLIPCTGAIDPSERKEAPLDGSDGAGSARADAPGRIVPDRGAQR
jgi:type II secretion system protein J